MPFLALEPSKKSRHSLGPAGKLTFPLSIFFLALSLFFSTVIIQRPVFAYSQIAEFICEEGLKDLNKGDLIKAENEFKKALVAEPGYPPAAYYLEIISGMSGKDTGPSKPDIADYHPVGLDQRQAVIDKALGQAKTGKSVEKYPQPNTPAAIAPELNQQELGQQGQPDAGFARKKPLARYLLNDPSLPIQQPIQIEEGKNVVISGSHIKRFLVVQPDLLYAERLSENEISVTAKNRGMATIIVWDDNGRASIECVGIMPIPDSPTLEEIMRKEEKLMGDFRLHYNLDWYSYYTGKKLGDIKRNGTYSWIHNLRMDGATPYGLLDAAITERVLSSTTDMTYISAGLTNGKVGDFKGFNLRAGDYDPYFNNMAIPSVDLRGVYLYSPAFDDKLNYAIFWGRENGGRYGTLSMEDYKTKNSFMSGFNLSISPDAWQNYKFSVAHGWGRDRESYLGDYAYDLIGNWNFDKQGYSYEVANDTKNSAQLFTGRYNGNKINVNLQLRDIDKQFVSITGPGWRQGEFGSLLDFSYRPTEKLTYTQRFDIYRDRLYPAEDNPNRFNEDLDSVLTYKLDPLTSLEASYTLQNDLGKLSQLRYQSPGVGVNRLFSLFGRDISVFFRYSYQDNQNYSTPTLAYTNEKLYAGLRFKVIGSLYYYFNREFNWLTEQDNGDHTLPNITETGLDWYDRIGKTPFWGALRFTWHDEERTESPLSFLSGEDYIEGYGELSYRPVDNQEVYASVRVRNIWKENPAAIGRIEATFNAGMKLLWDTGLRWDVTSNIQGYVFKDYNSDGIMDRDEPPVFGAKVWLGKKRYQVTDELGYFKFVKVRGKTAYVTLDTGTLPAGYILTVPVTQEVPIANADVSRVYFGVISRSEIRGMAFEDSNGDGEYSVGEKGVPGIAVTLDGAKTLVTGTDGSYLYSQAHPGAHELSADLNSIPIYYLPSVALKKKIFLREGETSFWNIPLRKIQK
ncbi:MAG: pilus assembly protein N-terminal domain-containing protein [Candidatus Omnitrophota bacterium]